MKRAVIFIIGVSGCGKSTVGKLLSSCTQIPYIEADDHHPATNIEKMSAGIPLTDEDRYPWLKSLNQIAKENEIRDGAIISSSALKEKYRSLLSQGLIDKPIWIFLKGSKELILSRVQNRSEHFMPESLLDSQFDILEPPSNAITIDIVKSPAQIVNSILEQLNMKNEFGIIGMGVMGRSLARNLGSKGTTLSLYNRHVQGVEEDVAKNLIAQHDELIGATGFDDLGKFILSLESPRKILLMVSAGAAIDNLIDEIKPFLSKGDILIDGGNSNYKDTMRRCKKLESQNISFLGCGISGGEKGALKGPSIMPGGDENAYLNIKSYLDKIAAKDSEGQPCCSHIGSDGAGHFIKMIHNGIEYAEMQLIAEVYELMRTAYMMSPEEIAAIFQNWNEGKESSYLLEITIQILRKKETDGTWLIDHILDKSGSKGTGSWSTIAACELGEPATMISSALFARSVSANINDRKSAHEIYKLKSTTLNDSDLPTLRNAYQFARIVNHHQGFALLKKASETYEWNLNLKEIARIWTNGCIIRSNLMIELSQLIPDNGKLLLENSMAHYCKTNYHNLNEVIHLLTKANIPAPCLMAANSFFLAYQQSNSAANIIQAQRDFFGAHTYQRKNDPSGMFYHTNWES